MPPVHGSGLLRDRELRDLRRDLGGIPRGRGRRIPVALRARVIAWTAARRTRGAGWRALARELGVPAGTLTRWLALRPAQAPQLALRPVAVLDTPARSALRLVAPSGLRIEGVTLSDVIAILRGLA